MSEGKGIPMWVAAMVGAAGVAPFMMGVLGAEKSKKIVRPIPEYDYLSALARFGAEEASKQDDFPAAQQILREEAILMKLLAEATKAMPSMRASERLRKLALAAAYGAGRAFQASSDAETMRELSIPTTSERAAIAEAARDEGAREMQERCARIVASVEADGLRYDSIDTVRDRIRALPVKP